MSRTTHTPAIQENVSLQPFTTLHVPARARWFAELTDANDLPALLEAPPGSRPPLVLGEGSNCLFKHDYDGLVIHMALQGRTELARDDDCVTIRVAAGENWHAFVRWSVENGCSGIENLALIPGTVGAAPIQNIGAYGVEVDRCIETVTVLDLDTRQRRDLERHECGFGYRDSLFKRQPGRFIVLAVTFRLDRGFQPVLDYAGLKQRLAERGVDDPAPVDVADAVESLRREKLPDPAQLGNAGSFFKNPVVPAAQAEKLREQYPDMPAFAADDGTKLSAGWLIEKSGMKGYRQGDAGISSTHALVLVNHGDATGEELWAVASQVRQAVFERFDIELEPEPRVY